MVKSNSKNRVILICKNLGYLALYIWTVKNRTQKQAYNYSVQFDARELSSGVYFYRMKAGSYLNNKKLILLKWKKYFFSFWY